MTQSTTNPFDQETQTEQQVPVEGDHAATQEVQEPQELAEVDTPEELDDETDEVPAAAAAGEGAKPKAEKKPKEPARATPPEGLITPVAFARELTKHLAEKKYQNKNGFVGREANEDGTAGEINLKHNPIPPQYIYSMINQTKQRDTVKYPLPTYISTHSGQTVATADYKADVHGPIARENLLKLDEALAWWDAKDERKAATAQAAADKAAKKAAKATAGETPTAEAQSGPIEEAE